MKNVVLFLLVEWKENIQYYSVQKLLVARGAEECYNDQYWPGSSQ